MAIKVIGRSILGELGFSQNVRVMGDNFKTQLKKIQDNIPFPARLFMTSMTGSAEIAATNGEYFPKIRKVYGDNQSLFQPNTIYFHCMKGEDKLRPGCDFIVWRDNDPAVVATFSREAPILAFESTNGMKALGVICRPSLMKYGDYLFSTIKETLQGSITVQMVCGNHYNYKEGSIPDIISGLSGKYDMHCIIGEDSEKNPECYHRGEKGNHVVAMW